MRAWLARASLVANALTGGERGVYLCARLAERYGPYSLPCRILDRLTMEPGHCRKMLFWSRFQR